MARAALDDMCMDIDPRIEWVKCSPGAVRGKLRCEVRGPNGTRISKTIQWDGVTRHESDALYEMNQFLTSI